MRDQVLSRYRQNQVALQGCESSGDALYCRQLVDRDFYRRARVQQSSKKEARTLDRFEQQMRSGQEQRKKTRHRELLSEILSHAKDFAEFHKKRAGLVRKKATMIKTSLESKEKKEQMAKDKEERDRLKALKENDMEAYINLISTQKNSRLFQILEQTNKYMEQLGAKVSLEKIEQQNKKKRMLGKPEDSEPEDVRPPEDLPEQQEEDFLNDSERIKMNLKNSSKMYYSVTHTIQEEIK